MWTTEALVTGAKMEIRDEKLRAFNGKHLKVTIMMPEQTKRSLDFDSYVIPSERANRADEYIKDLRDNDRI